MDKKAKRVLILLLIVTVLLLFGICISIIWNRGTKNLSPEVQEEIQKEEQRGEEAQKEEAQKEEAQKEEAQKEEQQGEEPMGESIAFEYYFRGFTPLGENFTAEDIDKVLQASMIISEEDWVDFILKYCPTLGAYTHPNFEEHCVLLSKNIYGSRGHEVGSREVEAVYINDKNIFAVSSPGSNKDIYAYNNYGIGHLFLNILLIDRGDVPEGCKNSVYTRDGSTSEKTEYSFEYKWCEKNAPSVDFRGEYYVWRDDDFSWKIQNYNNDPPCITIAEDGEMRATINFFYLERSALFPYNVLKTSEQVATWSIGMVDGELEEYKHGRVNRSIYIVNERIPTGVTEFEPDRVPRKFYRVIWGHDDCDAVLYVDFPYDWTREQVDEILEKVHVELTVDVLGEE